jgi:Ca2+-binding EF-hand superfamily protein
MSPKRNNSSYLQRIKKNENKHMFDLLNPTDRGIINKQTVLGVILPSNIGEKIGKIVEELIELDEELNFEEFCKAIEILEGEIFEKSIRSANAETSIYT